MPDLLQYGDRGPRVTALQVALNTSAKFKPARRLAVDGQMGPLTCAAVQQAKYALGYAREDIKPIAGEPLLDYLTGERKLPPEYAERRKRRMALVTGEKALRADALAIARKDVGLLEGASNAIKYNDWWADGVIGDHDNDGGAYCVRAGSYWYFKAGSTAVVRGLRWENTDAVLEDAKHGRNGMHLTSDPQSGHGFVIDWSGRSDPDHFGLFIEWLGGTHTLFRSLEANATLENGRQGVGYHTRDARQCWFVAFER